MLDKQFTILSGSTCIVVLLMLLARTDAAPQVGEMDAIQETVICLDAPSDTPIYDIFEVGYYNEDSSSYCSYDVDSKKCRLNVGFGIQCDIQLAKSQLPTCKQLTVKTAFFKQPSPNRLEMRGLYIHGDVPCSTNGSVDIRITEGIIGPLARAEIKACWSPIRLDVRMAVI
eukprot:Nk52_evm1s998 gene=Nk52_evmTU1s998